MPNISSSATTNAAVRKKNCFRNGGIGSLVNSGHIAQISDEALEGWIVYMRDALEDVDKALARRIIQQFVAKIVIKEGTGTLYYTFLFPDDSYMLS